MRGIIAHPYAGSPPLRVLVGEVLPREPLRQWQISEPFLLRYLFAPDPVVMGAALAAC